MKKLLISLAAFSAMAAIGTAQTPLSIARRWNDSLIKAPITGANHHAVDSVMLNAVQDAGTTGIAAYLRALPGYGEGKVLTVQANALVWQAGAVAPVRSRVFASCFASVFH